MKHVQITFKATLEDQGNIDHVIQQLRALLPADQLQIECDEYVELSAAGKNRIVWLADYSLDLPWERVKAGFDCNGGGELTEAASDFIAGAGVVKALYGNYPETDEYGMPSWAEHDDANSSAAKITVAEYGFSVANEDFEVAGRCTHDDSAGAIWLMVCLSEEDYSTFESLLAASPQLAPAADPAA